MARKAEYGFQIANVRGWQSTRSTGKAERWVTAAGWVTDPRDRERPLVSNMTPADARRLAARLIEEADRVDPPAPVEFAEVRPGVWKTATPEDGQRLDDTIDAALANLGTSLGELREATAEEWLLVEVDAWEGSHAAVTTAKMPLCGRKGVMMPLGGNGDPTCPDCLRALAERP